MKRRSEAFKARRRKGGAKYDVTRAKWRRRYQLNRLDPVFRAKQAAYSRKYYIENREVISRKALAKRIENGQSLIRSRLSKEENAARAQARYHRRRDLALAFIGEFDPSFVKRTYKKSALTPERVIARNGLARERYHQNRERWIIYKRERRAKQPAIDRLRNKIAARRYNESEKGKAIKRAYDKKQRWIINRIKAMARDDGIYEALAREYNDGQRSL
jgi:hypothetical protein